LFVLSLVALSGAASLTYELLWIRALGRHFGTSTPAIATVVATFMAGLGIGYVWFGRRADRSVRPFRLYQLLELCIAVTGLAVSLFLLRGGSWLDALARLCATAGPLSLLCTILVLALLMLIPTTAMGGTVPVLASALAREGQASRALALLYASNTLGAIAGALLPDFVLIPRYGMTLTACLAAAANLTIAIAIHHLTQLHERNIRVRASDGCDLRAGDAATHPTSDAADAEAIELEVGAMRASPVRVVALVLSAAGGFCALGLEVLWSRTLQHWAAALVTSFAVLLAVYLAALAAGAFLSERIAARTQRPLTAACVLTSLTALSAALPLWAAPRWRDLARAIWPRPEGIRRVGLLHEAVDALLHAGFLELFACLTMGATFPFIAAAWLANGKAGTRAGQLFIVNTFAGVLGTLVVGFWWLPQLGEQASYLALALLLASVVAICSVLVTRLERTRTAAVSGTLSFACVLTLTLMLPEHQLFQAHFRSGGHVLAVQQGATTTAAVAARFVYGEPHYLELLTPGTSMSSTRGDARRYMSVMAHAAMLSAARPERALLICYGVGNTAHALLAHPSLKRLDVVDTSSEVLALSPHFAAARGKDPLRDPRSHVFVDDGRHHLISHDALYDVITAEPPPPNHAGVTNLYSRELYQLARTRLAAGGVITQWLPVFQLSDDDVRAMIAAFVAELPHTALLYGCEQELVLIGSNQPLHMRSVTDDAFSRELQSSYIGSSHHLRGSVIQTDAELRRLVKHTKPLSDDRPTLQYPREDVAEGTYFTSFFTPDPKRALHLITSDQEGVLRAAAATERALQSLPLRDLSPPETRELALGRLLGATLRENRDDQGLWALLAIDSDRARLAERALTRPGAADLVAKPENDVATPDRARFLVLQDATWLLARRAFYAGDYARSLDLLNRLQLAPSEQARRWLFIAGALRALQQPEPSARAFRSAAAVSSDQTFRAACTTLAAQTSKPFDPSTGPWTLTAQ
jgi:spermidine synthase